MDKRIEIIRKEIISKMDQISNEKDNFFENVLEFQRNVSSIVCAEKDLKENSDNLSPRQYSCMKSAMKLIYERNLQDAWWEIYDFVTASDEKYMSMFEKTCFVLMLEMMVFVMNKKSPL